MTISGPKLFGAEKCWGLKILQDRNIFQSCYFIQLNCEINQCNPSVSSALNKDIECVFEFVHFHSSR